MIGARSLTGLPARRGRARRRGLRGGAAGARAAALPRGVAAAAARGPTHPREGADPGLLRRADPGARGVAGGAAARQPGQAVLGAKRLAIEREDRPGGVGAKYRLSGELSLLSVLRLYLPSVVLVGTLAGAPREAPASADLGSGRAHGGARPVLALRRPHLRGGPPPRRRHRLSAVPRRRRPVAPEKRRGALIQPARHDHVRMATPHAASIAVLENPGVA
jgi:hypothetical protein